MSSSVKKMCSAIGGVLLILWGIGAFFPDILLLGLVSTIPGELQLLFSAAAFVLGAYVLYRLRTYGRFVEVCVIIGGLGVILMLITIGMISDVTDGFNEPINDAVVCLLLFFQVWAPLSAGIALVTLSLQLNRLGQKPIAVFQSVA